VRALSVLTVHFGERDRVGSRLRADDLMQACEDRSVGSSVLLRGAEGFGAKHALRTDRLLTLSEDLPMALIAIDEPTRIRELATDLRSRGSCGLLTLEGVLPAAAGPELAGPGDGRAAHMTVIVGRRERAGGEYAHELVVEQMRASGMLSATALLGVDGTVGGERARARFFGRNARVPMMIVGVGGNSAARSALQGISQSLPSAPMMLRGAEICERGQALRVEPASAGDELCRLSVYASENIRHGDRTLHESIVRALRREGAPGVSTLRGQWGFDGPSPPSGERIAALGRHAPMVTIAIDTPTASARWLQVLHELAGPDVLITSERVSRA